MPYTVEETGPLSRKAQITVPAENFRRNYNRALKRLSGRVRLQGFRKGKIPMSVMKRNYGAQVLPDVVDELVNESVQSLLQETDNVLFIAQPELSELPNEQKDMAFTLEYELRPDLDPVGYLGVGIEKPSTDVTDDELEAELEALRTQHATLEPIEFRTEIKDGDVVTVDIRPLGDVDDAEALSSEDVDLTIGANQALPGLEEALIGQAFDATVTTTVQLDADFPIEGLRDSDLELEIKVKGVKKSVLPEIDDEFAIDTGLGETLIELRSNLRSKIQEGKEHEARHIAEDSLVAELLSSNDFELPPKFLDQQVQNALQQQINQMVQQGISPQALGLEMDDFVEELRVSRIKQLKTEFLLLAIAEKEEFQVEEDDLKAYFEHQAAHMGVGARELERYMMGDADRRNQAATSALLEKTLTHLVNEATVTEIEWPSPEDSEDAVAAASEEE